MRHLRRIALGSMIALLAGCSCGSFARGILGNQCELNTECHAPLVCRLGYCRNECATSADCTIGLACVVDAEGLGACQLTHEIDCTLDSDCPAPLVCRGDAERRQCVNACEDDRDCNAGARCVEGDDGQTGCIDEAASIACLYDGDCDEGMFCLDRRCRQQCFTSRDCLRPGWSCRADQVCCDSVRPAGDPLGCGLPPDGGNRDGGASDGGSDGGSASVCSGRALGGVRQLAVGGSFGCVLRGTGVDTEVLCWGNHGDIGAAGGELSSLCPTPVPALAGLAVVSIDAGGVHACAVLETGEVYCWGSNASGELGRGTTSPSEPPALVPGVMAAGVTASWANTCVWSPGAAAQCWGTNLWGSVGAGPCCACGTFVMGTAGGTIATPTTVTCVAQPQDLSLAGGGHVCGIVAGAVECWGKSGEGQLGTGGGTLIDDALELAAGEAYSCAIRGGDGSVHCWGENFYGNLGDGTTTSRGTRAPVVGLPDRAVQIDGGNHTCAVLESGATYCWGDGTGGAVHPAMTSNSIPVPQLVIASGALQVEVGARNSCALVGDQVRCWGQNQGQLGNGSSLLTVME